MTTAGFRRLALALPGASESAHMGHPDFRVGKKIFATLWPDGACGVVIITPEQQQELLAAHPKTFLPVKGGWGKRGCTQVRLETANTSTVRQALGLAWQRIAPKSLLAQSSLTST